MSKLRVLHIFNELSNGGNCHFIMNYYRHIDRSKIQFDFVVSTSQKGYFEDEIIALGGKIFHICPKRNLIKNLLSLICIVKKEKYKIIHRHTGSAFGYLDLLAAKIGGATKLILHSHNTQAGNIFLHKFSKIFFKTQCIKLACSTEAGNFLFGNHSDFKVITNAICCEKFAFSNEKRAAKRKELNIEDNLVIGHIGRFEQQKNHKRLLEIFADFHTKMPKSVLICIGDGSLLFEIKKLANKMNLSDHILFLGPRTDISELLCSFDVFLLPSLYEGFPFVLIEAQANGLLCINSTNVPYECKLLKTTKFISLDATNITWANELINSTSQQMNRENAYIEIKTKGFDLQTNAKKLQEIYLRD